MSVPRPSRLEVAVVAAAAVLLSAILLRSKLTATPAWTTLLERNHELLLDRNYTNNEQSRLLQFLVPEVIHRFVRISVTSAYSLQRFAFVGSALVVSYLYFRRWLPSAEALVGVLVIVAVMPLTFVNDLQESAPLLQLLFVVGLWLLVGRDRPVAFGMLLLLAVLVNETAAVLGVGYVAMSIRKVPSRWMFGLIRSIAVGAPAAAALAMVRYINRDRPQLGGSWHLPDNVRGMADALLAGPPGWFGRRYLDWLVMTVPFLVVALVKWRSVPRELKLSMSLLPVFFVGNLLTGIIAESRQMVPVLPLLIAASFAAVRGENARTLEDEQVGDGADLDGAAVGTSSFRRPETG